MDNTSEIERLRNRAGALRPNRLKVSELDAGPDAVEIEEAGIANAKATEAARKEKSSTQRFGNAFADNVGMGVRNIGKDIALRGDAVAQGVEESEGFLDITAAIATEMTKTSERFNDPEWNPRKNQEQKQRIFDELDRLNLDPESPEAKDLMSAGSEHVLNFDIAFIEDNQARMKELSTAGPAGTFGMLSGSLIDGDTIIPAGVITKTRHVGTLNKLTRMDNIKDGAKIGAISALTIEGANAYVDPSTDVKDVLAATVLSTGLGAGLGGALPTKNAQRFVDDAATVDAHTALRKVVEKSTETHVNRAIEAAAKKTGIDSDYLFNQARVESNFRTGVKASTSSATGLYQFIEKTWINTISKHGNKYGVNVKGKSRKELLELRKNPETAAYMAAELAKENGKVIQKAIGRKPDSTDLYLGHFFGGSTAGKFIRNVDADPTQNAVALYPKQAKSNRAVFYNADGTERSVGEVREYFDKRLNGTSGSTPKERVRYVMDAEASVGAARQVDTLAPEIEISPLSREIHEFIEQDFADNPEYTRGISNFDSFRDVDDNVAQTIIKGAGEGLYKGLDKIGLSPDFDKNIRSDNAVLQWMAVNLLNSPVGQIANTRNADNMADLMEKSVSGEYAPFYQRHYGSWYNNKYKGGVTPEGKVDKVRGWASRNFHAEAEMEFGKEVQSLLAHRNVGKDIPDAAQEVIDAADDIERAYKRMLDNHQRYGTEGFEDVEYKKGHFGVRWSNNKWLKAERKLGTNAGTARLTQAIKTAIMRVTPDMDEQMAFDMANAIKRNAIESDSSSPVGSLSTVSEDGSTHLANVLRDRGVPEERIADEVDRILYTNDEKGTVKSSRRRVQMDYTTPIEGSDMTILDLIDNDVYGVLDSASRGQSAEAARVAATGGLMQRRDLPKWRQAARDYARENGQDPAKAEKLFDEMSSMYSEGAFNGGVGQAVGRLNKLSRLAYLGQLAITQTAETGIAMGTDTQKAFRKFYGKSIKQAISQETDRELVDSLSALGKYRAPDELYVRTADLDDVALQDTDNLLPGMSKFDLKPMADMLDYGLDKGQRAMGLASGFYQVLAAQQRGMIGLSNNYFINGIINKSVDNKRLISMGIDDKTQDLVRKYAHLIERDADGHVISNNMNQWHPDDADTWRMAISRNVDHAVQVTRRGETHAWANTQIGGLMTGLKTFALNAMFSKTIKSARLADQVAAAQVMYTLGTSMAAVTASATVNGKLDTLDQDRLMQRALGWSAHMSPVLMLTDPIAHITGLDHLGDGQLAPMARYRYAQDGLIGLPAGLSALNDISGIARTPLDLLHDGKLDYSTINSLKAVPVVGRMYGVSPIIEQLGK